MLHLFTTEKPDLAKTVSEQINTAKELIKKLADFETHPVKRQKTLELYTEALSCVETVVTRDPYNLAKNNRELLIPFVQRLKAGISIKQAESKGTSGPLHIQYPSFAWHKLPGRDQEPDLYDLVVPACSA